MPYCSKCGIEVDNSIRNCPLCDFPIPEIPTIIDVQKESIELRNYYDELKKLKKIRKRRVKNIIFFIFMLGIIYTAVTNASQDFYLNGRLTFSRYVLSATVLFTMVLLCLFGYLKKWSAILIFLSAGTCAFLFSLDAFEGGLSWFFPLGLPVLLLSMALIIIPVLIIKKVNRGRVFALGVILASIAAFTIFLEIVIDLFFGELRLSWSIQTFIFIFSLGLIILFSKKIFHSKLRKKMKRFFHF